MKREQQYSNLVIWHNSTSRLKQLGVKLDVKVHTTRLKQRLLTHLTDMQAQKKGREILLSFKEDIDTALAKACELDSDNDAIHLAHVAKIVCNCMFGEAKSFPGFTMRCQKGVFTGLGLLCF